ncbi:hypothetical protein ABZ686_28605 [Streptomyces sp. NPDC006992]|uniref:hypothetical protein n=1 Tax=Streptomyces sp. NPDC006992 TaxID=3155601 RepID=UPI0033D4C08F
MAKESKEPGESPASRRAGLSDLFGAMESMANYYRTRNADLMKQLTAAVMPTRRISDAFSRQVADTIGLNAMLGDALGPLTQRFRQQWRDTFALIDTLKDRIYPENLRDAEPRLNDLEELLVEEGIPLMWVPGPKVVRALLDAPGAVERRRIIGRRWRGIVTDCESVANSVDHADLLEARSFVLDCVTALRDGHANSAQALAANLLDSLMHAHFEKDDRVKLTSNKKGKAKFDLNDYEVRVALTFAPIWCAYAEYWSHKGDPIPRMFARHASAHGVSRFQYSRINAVYGLMLATSVMKFFDVELEQEGA